MSEVSTELGAAVAEACERIRSLEAERDSLAAQLAETETALARVALEVSPPRPGVTEVLSPDEIVARTAVFAAQLERARPVLEAAGEWRRMLDELDAVAAYDRPPEVALIGAVGAYQSSPSEPANPLAMPGCTCPWNNGYRLSPLGHHVSCPTLGSGHTPDDACDAVNRLPYGMGHLDREPAP